MSPALQIAQARRTTARVVLITVVAIITALVLFAGGPVGLVTAEAQQTTPGVSIKFINPDSETSNEISDVNDGSTNSANSYHIVAWVNQNPPNALVEFEFQAGTTGQFQKIGNGTQVDANTWELFWDGSGMPNDPADGSGTTGTLRVNLYSGTGTGPVSQDNETVRVNRIAPSSPVPNNNDVPNTVEITYPVNGGVIGFFSGGGDYQAQVNVAASDNTETVYTWYTTTAFGSDPSWTQCSDGESNDDAEEDGVTCTLQGDDTPEQVKAIAATTEDANEFAPPNFTDKDSGDAHKATGYVQIPTSITVDNQQGQQTQSIPGTVGAPPGTFPCTTPIAVQVFDQQSRPVKGVNVDVHAQGPGDGLRFDDPDGASSPHSPPNSGNHGSELEANCETPTGPPMAPAATNQGDHDLGGDDVKHIESAGAGTNEEGKFTFALLGNQSGTTQWTVWIDLDNSDLFCEQEPHVDGSVGWGVAAPAPNGVTADQQTCPIATPPTPTRTATTTPPPSTSPPPSSPSPTQSSPSPTPTDEPETRTFNTSVSIDHDKRPSDFDGNVRSSNKQCRQGRDVLLKKDRKNKRDKIVGRDTTNRKGQYRVVVKRAKGKYYAVAKRAVHQQGNGDTIVCQRGQSKRIRVRRG